jgi:hypothetical protein
MSQAPDHVDGSPSRASRRYFGSAIFGAALFALILNTLAFTWRYSNPLVASDAWYFLDVFVRKIVDGGLSLPDFFAKRAGVDHAQPLNKLLLYANVKIAGMDFTYEAVAGIAFAVATLAAIFFVVKRGLPEGHSRISVRVCLLAIAALFLSIGNTDLYTWSLVTLGYSLHLFALLLVWFAWRSFDSGKSMALVVTGFVAGVCVDDSAFILVAACLGGLLFLGLRTGRYRAALATGGWLLLSLVASRAMYALIPHESLAAAPHGPGFAERLHALQALLPEFHRWLLIPSTAAIANHDVLANFFPEHWKQVELVVGVLVLAGQAWFWWSVWRARANAITFLAISLMLMAYGYWAGIVYGRVAELGSNYLYQQRYVLFYVMVPIALLLLAIERMGTANGGRSVKGVFVATASIAILIQVPSSLTSWDQAKYLDRYYQGMANQMFALARAPGAKPPDCVPLLTVCGWPPKTRADLFRILEKDRLNLFSRQFDDRHSMYEGDDR